MGYATQVVSLVRTRLGTALNEPRCSQKLVKNRRAGVAVVLGLVIVLCVVHLVTQNSDDPATPPVFGKTVSPESRPRLKILVSSYMRSGSTLCGNILQAHPGVFYVYEPLLYLWDHHVPGKEYNKDLPLRRRAKALWRKSKPVIPAPLDFLKYMFRCNLTTYNLDFLTNVAHSTAFTDSGCVNSIAGTNVMNVTTGCAMGVLERCQASSAVAQKAVRLTMAETGRLVQQDPSIRVVHLVRDPRGVLLSRMRFNQKAKGEMHKNITSICHRMVADVKEAKRINEKHWGRVLTVRYEDLAESLVSITSMIYEFVGLEMLPSVREFLTKMTSTDAHRVNGKIAAKSTFRRDPFKTAYKWRQDLPWSLVKKVDSACQELNSLLGYVAFQRKDKLRDLHIPAKVHNYGEGLLKAIL